MIDGLGATAFTYTDSGQLLTEDGPFARDTVTNAYSNRLRTRLNLAQPTGLWTNGFGYDFANRLSSVTSSAGVFTYTYEQPSTRLTYLSFPSGAYVYNQYDTMSRLTSSYLYSSTAMALDGHLYQYDAENQRTNELRADSSTVDYKYDKIGQLTVADSSVNSEDRGYFYDAAWNLNRRTNNGVTGTFTVDNKNQLTNAPSTVNKQTYDSNGNLITGHNGNFVYSYDDENQLIELIRTNGIHDITLTDFIYDGLGRLRERLEYGLTGGESPVGPDSPGAPWGLTSETHYIYDGWRVIQERDGSNIPTVSYTRGNDLSMSMEGAGGIGGLLARSSGYSSGNWTSRADYYADGNGNVTSLIDSNQSVVASYRYDPFGSIISKSGTLADANVYRFSSKEVHVISGMYYYGFRFYDPNLQRWINRDPLGDLASAVALSAEFMPNVDLDDEGDSLPVSQSDAVQFLANINQNLLSFGLNGPVNHVDALGMDCEGGLGPGSLNPENLEALDTRSALEIAEAKLKRSTVDAIQKSKVFGNGVKGSRAINVNKLKQALNPDQLRKAKQIAQEAVKDGKKC